MNASPVLLFLLFLSTCHGEQQDDSPTSGTLATTKAQKQLETRLSVSCPESIDIEPCECLNQGFLIMDCSKVQDEEQLRKVFSAFFPTTDFQTFFMENNKGLKVLEDDVFGDVSFQQVNIQKSVLTTVRNDSLKASLPNLTSIHIKFCQLAIFPFERLAEFTSLKSLYLQYNSIHSLPPLSSSSLLSFDLSFNPISHLSPDVFTLLAAVEQIYLDGSNLTEITSGTFRSLPGLFMLTLTNNKISYLHNLTFDLVSLPSRMAILNLENNTIDSVEVDAFKGMHEPCTINMAYNAFTVLEEDVWRPVLEKDINVSFEGNSLSCGCDVAWLVRDPQLLTLARFARCADGTLVTDLDPADFDKCGELMRLLRVS